LWQSSLYTNDYQLLIMSEKKISGLMQLNYLFWAFCLFCFGIVFLAFAWTIIGIPLWLLSWAMAVQITILALQRRNVEDWIAERDAKKAIEKQKREDLVKEKMGEIASR
jgi:glucan phosphoethanolaminetransferase (alkaline phosphatase superfamily)